MSLGKQFIALAVSAGRGPSKCLVKVEVDRDEFAACVRRGALLASEGSHAVAIEFGPERLKLGAKVSNVGEGEVEMAIRMDGEPLEVHFNPKYLLDYLKVAQGEKVKIEMSDPRSAVVLRDEGGLLYVLMPITLEGAS